MAVWTFIDDTGLGVCWDEDGQQKSSWDDGVPLRPGDAGFDDQCKALADASAAQLAQQMGKAVTPSYVCTPNWAPEIPVETE